MGDRGIVERIRMFAAKGAAGVELNEARLIENSGLEGDFYARGGDRQISILLAESRGLAERCNLAEGQEEKGLCSSRFKENILISGMPPNVLRTGTHLAAGGAVLEISGETKHCHEECVLYKAGKRCRLAGLNLFARIVKSGVIRNGDAVNIVQ